MLLLEISNILSDEAMCLLPYIYEAALKQFVKKKKSNTQIVIEKDVMTSETHVDLRNSLNAKVAII